MKNTHVIISTGKTILDLNFALHLKESPVKRPVFVFVILPSLTSIDGPLPPFEQ